MTTLVLDATGRRNAEGLEARGVAVRRGSRATGFDGSDDATRSTRRPHRRAPGPAPCAWCAQNFSERFLLERVLAGEIPEPFVDAGEDARTTGVWS